MAGVRVDLFKETFKRYKKRSPDLSDVIDFRRSEQCEGEVSKTRRNVEDVNIYARNIILSCNSTPFLSPFLAVVRVPSATQLPPNAAVSREAAVLGLAPPSTWLQYTLTSSPGHHSTSPAHTHLK